MMSFEREGRVVYTYSLLHEIGMCDGCFVIHLCVLMMMS